LGLLDYVLNVSDCISIATTNRTEIVLDYFITGSIAIKVPQCGSYQRTITDGIMTSLVSFQSMQHKPFGIRPEKSHKNQNLAKGDEHAWK
jgi:hypothetical protein